MEQRPKRFHKQKQARRELDEWSHRSGNAERCDRIRCTDLNSGELETSMGSVNGVFLMT